MNQRTRIEKDIEMLKESLKKARALGEISKEQKEIMELGEQYFKDAGYYLQKKDYFTAFGCINYAHGLLDALLKSLK